MECFSGCVSKKVYLTVACSVLDKGTSLWEKIVNLTSNGTAFTPGGCEHWRERTNIIHFVLGL